MVSRRNSPKAQPAAVGVVSLLLSTVTGSAEEGAEVAESVPATEVVEATTEAPAAVTIVQGEAAVAANPKKKSRSLKLLQSWWIRLIRIARLI